MDRPPVRLARAAAALLALACLLALAGCAPSEEDARPNVGATLLLDAPPNAAHAGIYSAVVRAYDAAEGVHLRIRRPTASTDPIRRLLTGRADFAVVDIHDVAIARERGRDVVCAMSIAQRPLAAVLALPGVRTPRDLEGRRVGVGGRPADRAILRAVIASAGGDPGTVETTPVGFDALPALVSGQVAGATGFWDVEGIALKRRRPGSRVFRIDDHGAPDYPELLLCTSRQTLQDHPSLVRATVAALQRGYRFTLSDPESSAADLISRVRSASRDEIMAQLDVLTTAFTGPSGRPGALDMDALRRWARWEARAGIVRRPPEVFDMVVTRYANAER